MKSAVKSGAPLSKLIRHSESSGFAALELTQFTDASVVRAVNPRKDRARERREARETAVAKPTRSFEAELLQSIRDGAWSSAITANRLEQVVRESAQAGREEGYREGYAEGLEEGRRTGREGGLQAARREVDDQLGRLGSVLENLLDPVDRQREQLQACLAQLIIRVAREVIRRELLSDPSSIRTVVREAIAAMPAGAQNIRVFLSSDDFELLQRMGSSLLRQDWQVSADPELELGDCRVQSDQSLIAWTTEERLNEVLKELFNNGS